MRQLFESRHNEGHSSLDRSFGEKIQASAAHLATQFRVNKLALVLGMSMIPSALSFAQTSDAKKKSPPLPPLSLSQHNLTPTNITNETPSISAARSVEAPRATISPAPSGLTEDQRFLCYSLLAITAVGGGCWAWKRANRRASGKQDAKSAHGKLLPGSARALDDDLVPHEKLSDITGIGGAMDQIRDTIKLWKKNIEGQPNFGPRGIILIGPPGTGKTHIAKGVANTLRCPYLGTKGTDFAPRTYVGTGLQAFESEIAEFANTIHAHERQLKKHVDTKDHVGRGVFFVDELDAIGRARGSRTSGGEDDKMTNLLLVVTDENNPQYEQIFFVFTSNREDIIDPAIIRSGRIKVIHIDAPVYRSERMQILDTIIPPMLEEREMQFANESMVGWLADMSSGCTGADLKAVMKEACNIAFLEDRTQITSDDVKEAFLRTKAGGRPRNTQFEREDLIGTMVHELGHAVFACLSEDYEIMLLSAVPRGRYLGVVYAAPSQRAEFHCTYGHLIEAGLRSMAGSMSESIAYGHEEVCNGGTGDMGNIHDVVQNILEAGLFGEHFAIQASEGNGARGIPAPYIEHANRAIAELRRSSRKILEKLGKEWFLTVAEKCVEMKTELVGQDAHEFIMREIGEKAPELKALIKSEITRLAISEFGPGYIFQSGNAETPAPTAP